MGGGGESVEIPGLSEKESLQILDLQGLASLNIYGLIKDYVQNQVYYCL